MAFPFDIGFLGGGQLARMSIMAAQRMGLQCLSVDPASPTPSSQIAPAIQGRLDDAEALAPVFAQCAVVTLENEFVPAKAIEKALKQVGRNPNCLIPNIEALATIQDKLTQRQALLAAGVPTPNAVALDDDGTLAVSKIGFPMVLKARFGGYDGKGTRYAKTPEELEGFSHLWESRGGWMAEEFVAFKRELAVMVTVGRDGTSAFPTMETIQSNYVCDVVFPSDADGTKIALDAVAAVKGIGLFGVELFETHDGKLLVNEIAPRPHNTGHYSLDWGGASQFDEHVRVVLGISQLPIDGLPAAMANLIGQPDVGDWRKGLVAAIQGDPGVRVHWYGKAESRPGRKMGHINAVGPDSLKRVQSARERFYAAWSGGPLPIVEDGPG